MDSSDDNHGPPDTRRPTDVEGLLAQAMSPTEVVVVWAAASDGPATGFRVVYDVLRAPASCDDAEGTIDVDSPHATVRIGGLAPATIYGIRLCALNRYAALESMMSGGVTASVTTMAPPPPEPVTARLIDATATTLSLEWETAGGSTAAFHVQISPGEFPPEWCVPFAGNGFSVSMNTTDTALRIAGLLPGTRYGVRVCSANGDVPAQVSMGTTLMASTSDAESLPPCDVVVPAGSYDFGELQSIFDGAPQGGDAHTHICLARDVVIQDELRDGPVLNIPRSDFTLSAAPGDDAEFHIARPIRIAGHTNVRISHLRGTMIDVGAWARPMLDIVDGSSVSVDHLVLRTSCRLASAIRVTGATLVNLSDSDITTLASRTHGLLLTDAAVVALDNVLLKTRGSESTVIRAQDSRIESMAKVSLWSAGESSHGLHLLGGASVGTMNGVTIRRRTTMGTTEGNAVGLLFDGGESYVDSGAIFDLHVCSDEDVLGWTEPLADLGMGGAFDVPALHGAHGSGALGAQTVPFDSGGATAGEDQGVRLGAPCFDGYPEPELLLAQDTTFPEFQLLLDGTVAAGDQNSDGYIAIELAPGVTVRNSDVIAGQRILIAGTADIYLFSRSAALPGRIISTRTDVTSDERQASALALAEVFRATLDNLELSSRGDRGFALEVHNSHLVALRDTRMSAVAAYNQTFELGVGRAGTIERVSIESTGVSSAAMAFSNNVRVFRAMDLDLTVRGSSSSGLSLATSSTLRTLSASRISTVDHRSYAIALWAASAIGEMIQDVTLTTHGRHAHGLVLGSSSYVGAMSDTRIIRGGGATEPAVAVMMLGTDAHVDSGEVRDVLVCTEGSALGWESGGGLVLADATDSTDPGTWAAPALHQPYDSGAFTGAQTFPFDAATAAAQGIVLGGICP